MTWMAAGAVRLACQEALAERGRTGGDVDVERVYRHLPTRSRSTRRRARCSASARTSRSRVPR